ncbi:MAG: hypothetical protein AB7F35_05020 [Acetobacteraceae bacterium]
MAGGAVSRLRLRVPPGQVMTARARTEDALRLADSDDRLLLLRRLSLGRLPVRASAADWTARAAERVAEQRQRAVHAAVPWAANADAVWFRSPEEARALLLEQLASGHVPVAWFWRLAVRGWDGAPLPVWLPRLLAETAGDAPGELAIARAVVRLAQAGHLPRLLPALAAAPPPPGFRTMRAVADWPDEPAAAGAAVAGAAARMDRVLAQLDPGVRARVLALARDRAEPVVARAWVARLVLIAAAPELVAQPLVLAAAVEAVLAPGSPDDAPMVALRAGSQGTGLARRATPAREPAALAAEVSQASARRPDPGGDAGAATPPASRAMDVTGGDRHPEPPSVPAPSAGPDDLTEAASLGAGVFLLVRPLVWMGLPEWLDARPGWAADGFGRALLHAIGQRMRVPSDDPVMLALNAAPDPVWDDAITAWRVGLDRWLRRTARIRLADVARKRGWIMQADEHVTIRFRVDDADLRLRRRALDIDPGWVPWLALVLRYHYRDRPVP